MNDHITRKECSPETEVIELVVTYYPCYDYTKLPPRPRLRCGCCGKELIWGEDIEKL